MLALSPVLLYKWLGRGMPCLPPFLPAALLPSWAVSCCHSLGLLVVQHVLGHMSSLYGSPLLSVETAAMIYFSSSSLVGPWSSAPSPSCITSPWLCLLLWCPLPLLLLNLWFLSLLSPRQCSHPEDRVQTAIAVTWCLLCNGNGLLPEGRLR